MRRGFVHIGVIVEPNGLYSPVGLKQWNPERYGSLDLTANGKFSSEPNAFELAHSIFTQVAAAVKNPSGSGLLGKLKVKNIVATGHSRSAGRLSNYYNRVHPLERVSTGSFFMERAHRSGQTSGLPRGNCCRRATWSGHKLRCVSPIRPTFGPGKWPEPRTRIWIWRQSSANWVPGITRPSSGAL